MSIYTKTGDRGETSLFGGVRVLKSNIQIEAYGSVDELDSFIGLVLTKVDNADDKVFLTKIQRNLYRIMNVLANGKKEVIITKNEVSKIEKKIDVFDKKLPTLTRFILQQGGEMSCWFHVLRTVCRRAERRVVSFVLSENKQKKEYQIIVKYLNRLSDLFFMMARQYNSQKEITV